MPSINADATLVNTAGRLAATEDKSRGLSDAINTGLNEGYDFTQKVQDDAQKEARNEQIMETQIQANEIAKYNHDQKVQKQVDDDKYFNEQWDQMLNNPDFQSTDAYAKIQENNDNVLRGMGKDIKDKSISLAQKKEIMGKFSKFTTEVPAFESEWLETYRNNAADPVEGSEAWIMNRVLSAPENKGGTKEFNYDNATGKGTVTYSYQEPTVDGKPGKKHIVTKNIDSLTGPDDLGENRETTSIADAVAKTGQDRRLFDQFFSQNPKNLEDLKRSATKLNNDKDPSNDVGDGRTEDTWTEDELWEIVHGGWKSNAPATGPTAAQVKEGKENQEIKREFDALTTAIRDGNTDVIAEAFPGAELNINEETGILTVKQQRMTPSDIQAGLDDGGFNFLYNGKSIPITEDNIDQYKSRILEHQETKDFDLNNDADAQNLFSNFYESNKTKAEISNTSSRSRNAVGDYGDKFGFNYKTKKNPKSINEQAEDAYSSIRGNAQTVSESTLEYKGRTPKEFQSSLVNMLTKDNFTDWDNDLPRNVRKPARKFFELTGQIPYFLISDDNKENFETQGLSTQWVAEKKMMEMVRTKAADFHKEKKAYDLAKSKELTSKFKT